MTKYRIIQQTKETKTSHTCLSNVFIPQYKNIWTFFIWKPIVPFYGIFATIEEAEQAIEIHRGVKTIKQEVKRIL